MRWLLGVTTFFVSYNLVDGLYILQIEGESSASLLGYKKTKSWVIH